MPEVPSPGRPSEPLLSGLVGRTILLIEDNEDNRHIYAVYLTHLGCTVLTAEDAESGLLLARARRPELVLMDLGLPGMDGLAAIRALKGDPATRDVVVVALTAHALAADRQRALDAGADRFVAKPIEPRALAIEVARLLLGAG